MARSQCSVEGCEKPVKNRGWCSMHATRWAKYGDPEAGPRRFSNAEDSFRARAVPAADDSGCVLWTGAKTPTGHGVIRAGGKNVGAHRYSWERSNGPVPDGLFIDHACRVPACVNTEHLRLSTKAQNGANRAGAEAGRRHVLPRGVYPSLDKYQVKIQHRGKQYYLGTFETVEEAESASQQARAEFFKEFAGLGSIRTSPYPNDTAFD